MRVTLVTYGTRGDAQPFLALGAELAKRGHRVRLLVPVNLEAWKVPGVEVATLPVDAEEVMRDERAQRMLAAGDMRSFFRFMNEHDELHRDALNAALVPPCEDAELIVSHGLTLERAAAVGAAKKIPVTLLHTFPAMPSAHFASPMVRGRPLPLGVLNKLTHAAVLRALWTMARDSVQQLRKQLGAPPAMESHMSRIAKERLPMVTLASPTLFDRPKDWHDAHVIASPFALSKDVRAALGEQAPQDTLRDWVEAGDAPIYIGLGSIPIVSPAAMKQLVLDIAEELDSRVVVATGWSRVGDLKSDDRVHVVRSTNHDWLLPRCRAALHHGGAGTTASMVRAAIPSVVVSVFVDQPFWANQLERRGVGAHVPLKKLSAPRVVSAFRSILDDATKSRARALAERMKDEDGVSIAATTFEAAAAMPPPT